MKFRFLKILTLLSITNFLFFNLSYAEILEKNETDLEKNINKEDNHSKDIKAKNVSENKISTITKKMEKIKKDIYDYVDDDVIPLSLLFSPCINFFWSKDGTAKNASDIGVDSLNFLRFTVMYDIQIGKTNFFISPGIGLTNQDYVFSDNNYLYKSHEKNSKVKFIDASKALEHDDKNYDYKKDIKTTGLHTSYFDFSLEIQFRSNKLYYKEGFYAAIGFKYGLLIGNPKSYFQYVDKNDNKEKKERFQKEPLGIANNKYSAIFRFGLGSIGAFLEWNFNNIFDQSKMEDDKISLKAMSVGLTLDLI